MSFVAYNLRYVYMQHALALPHMQTVVICSV